MNLPSFAALVAALGVALGYELAFVAVTRDLAKAISTSGAWRPLQNSLTPPAASRFGCLIYVLTAGVAIAGWSLFGFGVAILVFISLLVGAGITAGILAKLARQHYENLIRRSLMNRYADYARDNDSVRARAVSGILSRLGYPVPDDLSVSIQGKDFEDPRQEELLRPTPQEIEAKFAPIVERYSVFIQQYAHLQFGIPASDSDLSKSDLQRVLVLYANALYRLGKLDKELWEALRESFALTALLVSEEQWQDASKAYAAYEAGDLAQFMLTPEGGGALRTQLQILDDKIALRKAFTAATCSPDDHSESLPKQ